MCTAKERCQGLFQDLDSVNGKGWISSSTGMRKTMEGIFWEGTDIEYSTIRNTQKAIFSITSTPCYICLVLLCFADIVFFTNWRCEATLCPAGLLASFFQLPLLALCHIPVILKIFQTVSLLLNLLEWSVISDFFSPLKIVLLKYGWSTMFC